MTIHASVEFLNAVRGRSPFDDFGVLAAGNSFLETACGGLGRRVNACGKFVDGESARWDGSKQPEHIPDCAACVRLWREVTLPVRWDAIETLGLAPKLEAK